jgi:hypothetical protein
VEHAWCAHGHPGVPSSRYFKAQCARIDENNRDGYCLHDRFHHYEAD